MEPTKLGMVIQGQRPPCSLTDNNQISINGTRPNKTNNPLPKKQATQQYKADLSTQLAQNMMSDTIKKKNDTGRGVPQPLKNPKQLPLGTTTQILTGKSHN